MRQTNLAYLAGTLSRPPARRDLADGAHVIELDVTVREDGLPAATVNVAWPDGPDAALGWGAGDVVAVLGRVRRRFFRAGGATTSRTEVVAETVVPAKQARKVAAALAAAATRLAGE